MGTDIEWTPGARAVLAAASELFYDQGIHAVGVDAIAARAGVTKKTLYDRFGSKERLVVEYLAQRDQRWRAFLTPRLAG
ncbi:helix-turn-helix domain-containing protein, partial [Actinoalloteichus spitiensis]|uniref:helix-turn-helix domain-containing protein n=1 Tax=Actinoalloteichus spitiensis TaxID=252394 RepID=UPI00036FE8A0